MNKEEKKMLESLDTNFKELVKAQRELAKRVSEAPVLFSADCEICGKATIQISHITNGSNPPIRMASTTMISSSPMKPLRTCLQCGLLVWND